MSRFFRIMEKFSFHVLGGERIICTGEGRSIPLNDIKELTGGYFRKYDDERNDFERFRQILFKRLAKINAAGNFADMGDEAEAIVNKTPFPFFTDLKYWELFAAAVWLDAARSLIEKGLGGKRYVYPMLENCGETEKLANRIAVMSQHLDYMRNMNTFRILRWMLPVNFTKIWPDYTWEAMQNAGVIYAASLWEKGVSILGDKFSEAMDFLKKNGEVIK